MDELVLYVTAGDPSDKHGQESLAAVALVQKSHAYTSFRNAECPINGAAITGFGPGERLFVAGKDKALITAYAWGKETADQRFPVPEQMSCLALAHFPEPLGNARHKTNDSKLTYRVPWLLAAGSKLGKLYVWELALGDLICVKDAHYQEIATMEFSSCGTFLVTGGLDARVNVWKTLDLVTPDVSSSSKPHATFTDHALAITGIHFVLSASIYDCQVVSSSKDGTLRVFSVSTRSLLTTFVLPAPIECFARDPAGRAYYVGLSTGEIRQVALYLVNPYSHVLEAVGGSGKIVTVDSDPTMAATFMHHKSEAGAFPTVLSVSMDGMAIVSGDSLGRTFVADVVTKQVVKAFTACKSAIAYLHLGVCSQNMVNVGMPFDKKHRLLPPLKRVLISGNLAEHSLTMQLLAAPEESVDFESWLQLKAQEEFEFKNDDTSSQPAGDLEYERELQTKLDRVSAAYTTLKESYDELVLAHETRTD